MGKLGCSCGHLISDVAQADAEMFWGTIIPNGVRWETREKISTLLSELCVAYKEGNYIEWLAKNCPVYSEQNLQSIISDILLRESQDEGLPYARCAQCNSLYIQKNKNTNHYSEYKPSESDVCEEL